MEIGRLHDEKKYLKGRGGLSKRTLSMTIKEYIYRIYSVDVNQF